ncbi:hypothetical protein BDZ45DRAFT_684903 [Acephala macrosclerotiorum]|nr:hypothetical protein BDZ45DRAFT_684903 [Acephala macrosclerotiorum]
MEDVPELVFYLTSTEAGQKRAKEIAEIGREWFFKAFRDVDLSIYTYRLLLELARLQDPKRQVSVAGNERCNLRIGQEWQASGRLGGISLISDAANRAAAVGSRAQAVAAGSEVAEAFADLVGWAVNVSGVASNVAAVGLGGVDVTAAFACLDGSEESSSDENNIELHDGV